MWLVFGGSSEGGCLWFEGVFFFGVLVSLSCCVSCACRFVSRVSRKPSSDQELGSDYMLCLPPFHLATLFH
jgi:hypothetical protein